MDITTDYFGSDLSVEDYERLRINHIQHSLALHEPALFDTKWFDYRFLHPTQATYLFAFCYRKAMRRAMRRRTDLARSVTFGAFGKERDIGKKGQPIKKMVAIKDCFRSSKSMITGLWRARQTADQYGIPYYSFCRGAVEYAERRKWNHYPKPQHLYSNLAKVSKRGDDLPGVLDGIIDYWQRTSSGKIMTAHSDFYRAENFTAHPYQKAHINHVINAVVRSKMPMIAVAELVYERGVLRPEWITNHKRIDGHSLMARAEEFYHTTKGEDPCQLLLN